MTSELSWLFKLYDGISAPATRIADALNKTTLSLDRAAKATDRLAAAQAKLNQAAQPRLAALTAVAQNRAAAAASRATAEASRLARAQIGASTAATRAQARQAAAIARVTAAATRAATAQTKLATAQVTALGKVTAATLKLQAVQARAAGTPGGGGGIPGTPGGGPPPGGGRAPGSGPGVFSVVATFPFRFAAWAYSIRALERAVSGLARTATAIPRSIILSGLEHTAMKESVVAGMEVVLGSRAKADSLVQEAIRFAAVTPMTTGETIKGFQQLVMGGLPQDKVLPMMTAISDLSSLNMDRREEGTSTISRDIMQIVASGKLTGHHLKNLSSWGLPRQELFAQLAGGMIPALKGAAPDVVAKAVSTGKISAEAFLIAFERTMQAKGGGVLGGISDKQSQTMAGLWSTLRSRPEELLMNMDKTPAWDGLKTVLRNLNATLDYRTDSGARIQTTLATAFNEWVGALTKWLQDPVAVQKWVMDAANSLTKIVPAFTTMASALSSIAGNLDRVASVFSFVFGDKRNEAAENVRKAAADDPSFQKFAAAPWWQKMAHAAAAWTFGPKAVAAGEIAVQSLAGPQPPVGARPPPSAKDLAVPRDANGWRRDSRGFETRAPAPLSANIHINVEGATKEDAKAVAGETKEQVYSMLLEHFGVEAGTAAA